MKRRAFAIFRALEALAVLVLLFASSAHASVAPPARPVFVTIPWLSGIARFIVGTTTAVQPLASWAPDGSLRASKRMPQNPTVIAIDPEDAARYNLKPGQKGLYLLYGKLPIGEEDRISMFFDPSILPFLSQRMLVILCELEPDNYPFYQRRLAEFQSRLESTLEVGRSLIGSFPILDLAGAASPWVRAASPRAVRPPDDLWAAWAEGARREELSLALKEAARRGWPILVDAWTPARIRSQVLGAYKNIYVGPPEGDYEFFAFLHDIYLKIWSESTGN
ncbi:MAG: hypothetical protein LBS75_08325 [Synergistaceae bacterium]|jgi:hypothetical protein|nr:hypothetical protein [Synergistaceae bacterium]